MRKVFCLFALIAACSGESDFDPILTIDSSCAEVLCGWEVVQGNVAPSGSWHEHQRAVKLEGVPAQISKRLGFVPNIDCISMGLLAHVEADARLALQLDFNDDRSVDTSAPVPAVQWRHIDLGLRAPPEFRALRVTLSKQGPGSVRIASLILDANLEHCKMVPPTKLADGAICSADATCASGRCVLGQCASCPAEGCNEGEGCRTSDECRDGACAAGVCRACAEQGTCAAGEGCSISGQCASGSCTFGDQPSLTRYPGHDGVCGDCDADSDCGSGFCVRGHCSACRTDRDCAEGTVCRYADSFDVSTRACLPRISSTVQRGGLCETFADCASGLACAAPPNRAPRCGVACVTDDDCGDSSVCAAPGATRAVDPPAALAVLPAWSSVAGRLATCYRRTVTACEVQEQCTLSPDAGIASSLACCDGECTNATLNPDTNSCVGGDSLPN